VCLCLIWLPAAAGSGGAAAAGDFTALTNLFDETVPRTGHKVRHQASKLEAPGGDPVARCWTDLHSNGRLSAVSADTVEGGRQAGAWEGSYGVLKWAPRGYPNTQLLELGLV